MTDAGVRFCALTLAALCSLLLACAPAVQPSIAPAPEPTVDERHQHDEALAAGTERLVQRLAQRGAFLDDTATAALIRGVVQRFHLPADSGLEVRLVRNPLPNATVLPNGMICVHTGLVARLTHPDQLAFVLAHEISHWKLGHSVQKVTAFGRIGTASKLLDVLGTPAVTTVLPQDIAEAALDTLTDVAVTGYSRELEREADANALTLLSQGGFDIARAADVLLIYRAMNDRYASITRPLLLGTHPSNGERFHYIREWLGSRGVAVPAESAIDDRFVRDTAELRIENSSWNRRVGRYLEALDDLAPLGATEDTPTRVYLERAEVHRKMAEEFGRARRGVSNQFWEAEYPGLDDVQVRTLWFKRAGVLYDRVIEENPLDYQAFRGRGLLLALFGNPQGVGDLERYLNLRPDAPDRPFITRVVGGSYAASK